MKVKFIGNPNKNADGTPVDTSEYINMFGVKFKLGETQDISKLPKEIQAKFAGNSHFEVMKGGG